MDAQHMWRVYHRDQLEDAYLTAIGKTREQIEPICYCADEDKAILVAYDYIREGFVVKPGQTVSDAWEKQE